MWNYLLYPLEKYESFIFSYCYCFKILFLETLEFYSTRSMFGPNLIENTHTFYSMVQFSNFNTKIRLSLKV